MLKYSSSLISFLILPIFKINNKRTKIWPIKAFVEATPTSGPTWIGKTKSDNLDKVLSVTLTIAHVFAPFFYKNLVPQ